MDLKKGVAKAIAPVPEIRITAIAPAPEGVANAIMVSFGIISSIFCKNKENHITPAIGAVYSKEQKKVIEKVEKIREKSQKALNPNYALENLFRL